MEIFDFGGAEHKIPKFYAGRNGYGKSAAFYREVLVIHVIMDFSENKTLTGGLALQTVE